MFLFNEIPPNQFSLLATLLGLLLAADLNEEEQNAIGNFFLSLGQSILTHVAQLHSQKSLSENKQQFDDICNQIDQLNTQLNELKRIVK